MTNIMAYFKRFSAIVRRHAFPDIFDKEGESKRFYMDFYFLLIIAAFSFPYRDVASVLLSAVFCVFFLISSLPFLYRKVFPDFKAFFRGKNKLGVFVVCYFLSLALGLFLVVIHAKFRMHIPAAIAKAFIGYYVFVFAAMPIILLAVYAGKFIFKVFVKAGK